MFCQNCSIVQCLNYFTLVRNTKTGDKWIGKIKKGLVAGTLLVKECTVYNTCSFIIYIYTRTSHCAERRGEPGQKALILVFGEKSEKEQICLYLANLKNISGWGMKWLSLTTYYVALGWLPTMWLWGDRGDCVVVNSVKAQGQCLGK